METIAELLTQGWRCQWARQPAQAEQFARRILEVESENGEARHLLGVSLHARGRLAEAIEYYQAILRKHPTWAKVANDLGTALAMQGRLDEAIGAFERVLQVEPASAEAHGNLANALRLRGRHQEGIAHFEESLRLRPDYAEGHHNLGLTLLAQNRPELAINSFQQALQLKPNYGAALTTLQQVLTRHPNFPEAQNNLGNALVRAGRLEEARAAYEHAIRYKPTLAEAHNNLANLICRQGLLDEGIALYRQALTHDPNYADAHNNLGNAFKDQGSLDEAIACFQRARQLKPDMAQYHSNLLGAMLYHPAYDAAALRQEHRRWEEQHALSLKPAPTFAHDPSPERRLRIGYVSADFRDHVVGRNLWPLLHKHDHRQFEVTLYGDLAYGDALTQKFQQCADTWCSIAAWPDERVARQIREDRIDILVDLGLHTGTRLPVFARKPAPVQVTFAGYPGTTGLRAIDYRLTDPYLDPPGEHEDWYAEESHRLPHSFWCYEPQTEEPAVGPLPALARGQVTFGCLNNFCKINEEVLALWAQVLRSLPESRLLLLAKHGSHRQRTLAFLAREGIAAERVTFFPIQSRPQYLALYQQIDLGLDTFPYSGHTTSLDSFWMGVPVVTLLGRTVVGRAGLSQLANLGLEELAATTPKQFVSVAVSLARDLPRLTVLHVSLRERMKRSPLMDAAGFARDIEQAYRFMWRRWCAV
jgi:predicted O-linked N-acetylglucosamine transferase (SPINDLY family)